MKIGILAIFDPNDYVNDLRVQYPNAEITIIHINDLLKKKKLDIIRRLRSNYYDSFVVYCEDLDYQAGLLELKIVSFLTKADRRLIIDKKGKSLNISLFSLFINLPKFIVESVMSFFIVVISYLALSILPIFYSHKHKFRTSKNLKNTKKPNGRKIAFLHMDFLSEYEKIGGHIGHIKGLSTALVALKNELFFISPCDIPSIERNITPIYEIVLTRRFSNFSSVRKIIRNWQYIIRAWKILKRKKTDFL